MDWSSFFAKFIGIYLLIIVTIWLVRKNSFETGLKDVIKSNGMFALTGAVHIIMGLTIVILHPIWTLDWRGLITLIGYVSILQGIIRLAFPISTRQNIFKSLEKGYWVWIMIAGTLGTILTYNGFNH